MLRRCAACAVGLALLPCCQDVLGLGPVGASDAGGPASLDAPMSTAGAPPPCASVVFSNDFTDPAPCAPNGDPYGGVSQGSGTLSLMPAAAQDAAAGCSTKQAWNLGQEGAMVELVRGLTGTNAYAGLKISDPDIQIGAEDGQLMVTSFAADMTYGTHPYDGSSLWIRIRYDPARSELVGEYFAGTQWDPVATVPNAANAVGQVVLDASLYKNTSFQGPAEFAHLRVCR